jgi:hypothetical protein
MHAIRFVKDDEMPDGHDFIAIATAAGDRLVVYRASAVTPAILEDSWAAVRALEGPPTSLLRSAS